MKFRCWRKTDNSSSVEWSHMFVLEEEKKERKKPDYLNEFTALITISDNEKIKARF